MSNIGNKEVMARNILHYLEKSGRSQKEVAEYIDAAPSTFNAWVKAKKYPRIDKIELMADFFGIKKSDLIEDHTANDMWEFYGIDPCECTAYLSANNDRMKHLSKWIREIGSIELTDEETDKIIDYAKYIVSQRR